ncbi:MAG: hypothetical protein A2Y81_01810 [Nitrospirae bacterium RBG_13_43_8]|nr:MAG: hypothetical protein A2Y81_01810 [Nitrospirae bacterium RBG_13_43_8]
MNMEGFQSWIESYGRAWESHEPQIFADLFTDDASYYVNPFSEPLSGRSALRDYWSNIVRSQEQTRFDYEVLAITQDIGIAHWWTSFVYISSKTKVKLDGIFVISLNDESHCKVFKQWWHWLEYS